MSYALGATVRQAADEVLLDVVDEEEPDDEPDEELDEDDDEGDDVSEEEDEDEEPSLFAAVDLGEPLPALLDEEPRLSFR